MEIIHQHFEIISSTQTYARDHISCKPHQFFIISADQQTRGIGQRSKEWRSPMGNIYVSYVFALPVEQSMLFLRYPSVMALCVIDALEFYEIHGRIKWINDVLINQKKIAGILCENHGSSLDHPHYFKAVVGIGLNVNTEPLDTNQPVTSMMTEIHTYYDVKDVLTTLTNKIMMQIPMLQKNGPAYLYDRIHTYWDFLNQMVTVTLTTGETITGIFKGVRPDGACIIDDHGQHHYVTNGHLKG